MASLPKTMKAVKTEAPGKAGLFDIPLPILYPDSVLVKVAAVAINPTDWKHLHREAMAQPGHVLGCDFAGTIVALGPDLSRSLSKGDRVAGFVHGSRSSDATDGGFAEYTRCLSNTLIKLPDSMSFEAGSTFGIAIATQGQGLYQTLKLPLPDSTVSPNSKPTPLLIYGGSASMGLSAIEFAKLSGCKPIITTCSPRNFDLVKARGADFAIDYADANACIKQIRDIVGDDLEIAYDCVSERSTAHICAMALTQRHGVAKYSALLPPQVFPRDDMALCTYRLGYTVHGDEFEFAGNPFPPSREDFDFAKMFYALAEKLVAEGKVTPTSNETRPGGLQGVIDGMEALKNGEVSGSKLVYQIS